MSESSELNAHHRENIYEIQISRGDVGFCLWSASMDPFASGLFGREVSMSEVVNCKINKLGDLLMPTAVMIDMAGR